mmetsp:Transcript_54504/g.80908  ORF Transcript_54504/g.80908 Transcript_54504/m.80908 type:complete len:241 (-) Transcript_54504:112-834(-)
MKAFAFGGDIGVLLFEWSCGAKCLLKSFFHNRFFGFQFYSTLSCIVEFEPCHFLMQQCHLYFQLFPLLHECLFFFQSSIIGFEVSKFIFNRLHCISGSGHLVLEYDETLMGMIPFHQQRLLRFDEKLLGIETRKRADLILRQKRAQVINLNLVHSRHQLLHGFVIGLAIVDVKRRCSSSLAPFGTGSGVAIDHAAEGVRVAEAECVLRVRRGGRMGNQFNFDAGLVFFVHDEEAGVVGAA